VGKKYFGKDLLVLRGDQLALLVVEPESHETTASSAFGASGLNFF